MAGICHTVPKLTGSCHAVTASRVVAVSSACRAAQRNAFLLSSDPSIPTTIGS